MNSELSIREKIWQIIAYIPEGRVASYGQIACVAGCPNHARLVGNTLRNLPKDTKLPWHRVINSQGRISFPESSGAYQEQRNRLEAEGVIFAAGRISLKEFGWQDGV